MTVQIAGANQGPIAINALTAHAVFSYANVQELVSPYLAPSIKVLSVPLCEMGSGMQGHHCSHCEFQRRFQGLGG